MTPEDGADSRRLLRSKRGAKPRHASPSVFPSLLVAIVGGSGAGKTWLAKKLQSALGPDAARLSLDDFYRDRSHLNPARRAKLNFDHPRAIDWPHVKRSLRELRAGRAAGLPRYSFKDHCRLPGQNVLVPKPVVLVDGLWLLRRPSLRKLFDLKIYIDCPARARRSRRVARDSRSRGRTRAAVLDQLRNTVEPMHDRFVAPQQKWADIVLRHDFREQDIRRLARQLRDRLKSPEPPGTSQFSRKGSVIGSEGTVENSPAVHCRDRIANCGESRRDG